MGPDSSEVALAASFPPPPPPGLFFFKGGGKREVSSGLHGKSFYSCKQKGSRALASCPAERRIPAPFPLFGGKTLGICSARPGSQGREPPLWHLGDGKERARGQFGAEPRFYPFYPMGPVGMIQFIKDANEGDASEATESRVEGFGSHFVPIWGKGGVMWKGL